MSLENRINKTAQKIDQITKRLRELEKPTIKTQAFTELEGKLKSAQNELQKLRDKQAEWENMGISSGGAWDALCSKIGDAEDKVFSIAKQMEKLEKSGGAYTSKVDSQEYDKLSLDLANANNEMEILKTKEREVIAKQKQIDGKGFSKIGKSAQKAADGMKRLKKESNAAHKGCNNLLRTMQQMMLSMVVFQIMYKGMEFLKSGLQNLALYSKEYNKTMSELTSSTAQLKNAFAAAFQPILNMVIPILSQLVSHISAAANAVSRFFAILGGKSTYTKAIKQNKDYAASLDKVGGASDKAQGSLAGFDDLDVLQKDASDSGGGDAGGADGSGFIEESVGDTSKFEEIKASLESIAEIFKSGFLDGLGEWKSRLGDIREKTEMIRKSLSDIFSNPEVQAGAADFADSIVYNLGRVAGSVVSIGLTIGQNLIGGLADYLNENADRIKDYLVSMFDIGDSIADKLGDFAESFAYIFEAFGDENGQKLTSNLVGIFSDAFMGVTELVGKFIDDVLGLIIDPFVENKEKFRTAVNDLFGVLAEISGTIKDTLDSTFDGLNQLYDEHIGPNIKAVTNGLSELAGKFMEFWNTYVSPVLDNMTQRIEEAYSQHVQPVIDKAIELVGNFSDLLRLLWETVLQPLLGWVIDNVLPLVMPIIDELQGKFTEFCNGIADGVGWIIGKANELIEHLVSVFSTDWKQVWKNISDAVRKIWSVMVQKIKDFVLKIKTGVIEGISALRDKWIEIWTSVKERTVGIFNGIWSSIKGVINSIIGGVEKMANGVINGINGMIAALNSISFTIPDWSPVLGGKSFSMNLSPIGNISIPRLANGGYTTGSTLANIGEAGKEVVLPLERDSAWAEIVADKLASKMPAYHTPGTLIMEIEGQEIARVSLPFLNEETQRVGMIFAT